MPSYQLIQTLTSGKPARFSANGKRISRDEYERIIITAGMFGRHECFNTRAWPLDNGGTKRKNYSYASWSTDNA